MIFVALLMVDAFRRPGLSDLKGGFEEISFIRNEQNKGGIIRIYAFVVADTTDAAYMACGELLPHNEYGSSTEAYFFAAGTPAPKSLSLAHPHFDTLQFRPVAMYSKGADGAPRVIHFP